MTARSDENDQILNAERLNGGVHNDVLVGNDGVNIIQGGSGRDQIAGAGGNDELFGDGQRDRSSDRARQRFPQSVDDQNDLLDGGDGQRPPRGRQRSGRVRRRQR